MYQLILTFYIEVLAASDNLSINIIELQDMPCCIVLLGHMSDRDTI